MDFVFKVGCLYLGLVFVVSVPSTTSRLVGRDKDGMSGSGVHQVTCDCRRHPVSCDCGHFGSCVSAHHGNSRCDCRNGYTGDTCSIAPTTQAPVTTPHPTTVPPPLTTKTTKMTSQQTLSVTTAFFHCDKLSTIEYVAKHIIISNPNAVTCTGSGTHDSHEAFVFNNCQSIPTDSSTWTPGINVGTDCNKIPLYTAVAAFSQGRYNAADSLSGVLVQCRPDGFELAAQRCGIGPALLQIHNNGTDLLNSNVYFTIQ